MQGQNTVHNFLPTAQIQFAVLIIFPNLIENTGYRITILMLQNVCFEKQVRKCSSFNIFYQRFCFD